MDHGMRILYIENNFICEKDVINAFDDLGCEIHLFPSPPQISEEQEFYLQQLLVEMRNVQAEFIFSTGFIPFLSLACGVLQMPYVTWLVDDYHPEHKNAAIRNDWNFVFVADSVLYGELKEAGINHVYFLPLAAPEIEKKNVKENDAMAAKYKADISFIGSVLEHEKREKGPLSDGSNLKDATKGYLAGCVACQLQTKKLPLICSKFPEYVWEDLKREFPIKNQNSLESAYQYYANTYFNDAITYDSRIFYLQNIVNTGKYKRINHYSRFDVKVSKKVHHCGYADYYEELPLIAANSKINMVMAHYNLRAGISTTAWMIMGAGGFLLTNAQADFSILEPIKPAVFSDVHEMRHLAEHYYNHREERVEIIQALSEEINKKHTYRHRIEELLSVLVS